MKKCENNGCTNNINVPSIDCPGQCHPCSVKSRGRVSVAMELLRKKPTERNADATLPN